MRIHLDFETRSTIDLPKSGMFRYAESPTTEALCLAYAIDDGPVDLWHRGHPDSDIIESDPPEHLFSLLTDRSNIVEAHNAAFERCIFLNWGKRVGWPHIHDHQWRCTAAKAAYHNLPRALEGVSYALNLAIKKDDDGHRLMLKLSKPRKATLNDASFWNEKPEELKRVWEYCQNDVEVERLLSHRLQDLPPNELAVFQADMQINARGIACDRALITKALNLIHLTVSELNAELAMLTDGDVTSASQRDRLLTWLRANGARLPDLQGTTVDRALKQIALGAKVSTAIAKALRICRSVNRTSTAKYDSMRIAACADGRIRGMLMYHGAGTGRWAGRLVQPHNFPKGNISDMNEACQDILDGDKTWVEALYGDVMEFLSGSLRGALIAAPGKDLLAADYKSIEAMVTLWLAGDEEGLEVFRRGEDIYKFTAASIYNIAYEEIKKDQRQMGKQAVLGLGFQMGWRKFKMTCAKYAITIEDDFAKLVVTSYRNKYHLTVDFWWDCERAAILAVQNPGRIFRVNRVAFGCKDRFLFCRLPSGRRLAYYDPIIKRKLTPWGEMKDAIHFMGTNSITHHWCQMDTYGGKIVENAVQGTARDFMAEAILRVEATGIYPVILTVHDEVISEVNEDEGDLKEFENLLSIVPSWGEGCPITAEGWRGKRYKK